LHAITEQKLRVSPCQITQRKASFLQSFVTIGDGRVKPIG